MKDANESPSGLIDFIDRLRRQGFNIGTEQYVAAMKLAAMLALRDDLSAQPRKFADFLAPVLCSSPDEQATFPSYFAQWFTSQPERSQTGKPVSEGKERDVQRSTGPAVQATTRFWKPRYVVIALTVVTMGIIAAVIGTLSFRQTTAPQTLTVIVANTNGPVVVQFSRQDGSITRANLTGDGETRFSYKSSDLPATVIVESQGSQIPPRTIEASVPSIRIDLKERPTPTPTGPGWWLQMPDWFMVLASLGVLVLIYLTVRRVLKSEWRFELKKGRGLKNPRTQNLMVKGARERLTQVLSLRRTSQELRQHRPVKSHELDVDRTIDLTLRRGPFTPTYRLRKASPEYLVLVDRANLSDQRAQLTSEMLANLKANGVFIDQYSFQDDPRLCRAPGRQERSLTLSDLASRHPDHCLVIFSNGEAFFDPLTGNPHPWLERLNLWEDRFLLSSEMQSGDYRECVLQEIGMPVLPPDSRGMVALSEQLRVRDPLVILPAGKPLPDLLRARPHRWTEEHPPAPEIIQELIAQLKEFLGDEGYYCLSACAVYPKLYWDLTLYLGLELVPQDRFEEQISSLVRLPWFRDGSMPDWLRRVLIHALDFEEKQRIQGALEHLLRTTLQNPEGFVLPIVLDQEAGKQSKVTHRRSYWHRSGLNRFLLKRYNEISPDAPLHDYVFVDFMTGRGPDPLAVPLPAEVSESLSSRELTRFESYLINAIGATTVLTALLVIAIARVSSEWETLAFSTVIMSIWVGFSLFQLRMLSLALRIESTSIRTSVIEQTEQGRMNPEAELTAAPQAANEMLNNTKDFEKALPERVGLTLLRWAHLAIIVTGVALIVGGASSSVFQGGFTGSYLFLVCCLWGLMAGLADSYLNDRDF